MLKVRFALALVSSVTTRLVIQTLPFVTQLSTGLGFCKFPEPVMALKVGLT